MKFPRLSQLIVVCAALVSMLFMQIAAAAYTCPSMVDGSGNTAIIALGSNQMTGCDGMDTAQPNLCHVQAHGDQDKQSFGNPAPDISPFIAARLLSTVLPVKAMVGAQSPLPAAPLFNRTTAPPIAIRNCCFRI